MNTRDRDSIDNQYSWGIFHTHTNEGGGKDKNNIAAAAAYFRTRTVNTSVILRGISWVITQLTLRILILI